MEQSVPGVRIGTFGLAGFPAIANQVLKFRTKAQTRVTPSVHRTSHGQ
jgi:hypothetical protein